MKLRSVLPGLLRCFFADCGRNVKRANSSALLSQRSHFGVSHSSPSSSETVESDARVSCQPAEWALPGGIKTKLCTAHVSWRLFALNTFVMMPVYFNFYHLTPITTYTNASQSPAGFCSHNNMVDLGIFPCLLHSSLGSPKVSEADWPT